MSDRTLWQGYGLVISDSGYTASSLFHVNGKRVFGADSDFTTLAFALLDYLSQNGVEFEMIKMDENFDTELISKCFALEQNSETECSVIMKSHDSSISLAITGGDFSENDFYQPKFELDEEFHAKITEAWNLETSSQHVSQGAYVSSQQHTEASTARLRLLAQVGATGLTWPPRELQDDGSRTSENVNLKNNVKVLSWTKLSAGGAPSEFSIRSPILGGITTIFAEFEEGPRGVFMLSDESGNPEIRIGVEFNLAVRRLYAQEGIMRYSLKAIGSNK